MIFNPKTGEFTPKKGPIFSNIVLADEINRAPAKVQSALLEAMAEKQVTIGEVSYPLETPFLVLATQNPLEQEGTYPLPEAQMDRFLFKIQVKYPTKKEELEILNRMSREELPEVEPILSREEVLFLGHCAAQVFIDEKLKNYIVDLVLATREPKQFGLQKLAGVLQVGASPRASISLIKASRAHALLRGRGFVTLEDIRAVAFPILRHRLILSFEADAENVSTDEVVREILSQVEVL
jgi:MoxR-like ATPase